MTWDARFEEIVRREDARERLDALLQAAIRAIRKARALAGDGELWAEFEALEDALLGIGMPPGTTN